jgi:FkbM family methyltransferase
MKRYFRSADYHIRKILFEKFALPKVINEKISKVVLKKYLSSNPVIVDCGAHDGADTIELANLFKHSSICAFEPIEHLFNKLKARPNPQKNIKYFQLALADKTGTMDFYVSEGESDASSSLLEPKHHLIDHPETVFNSKISVKTSTLDSWAKNNGIDKVDLLWLDMQGFELNMLRESKKILNTVSVIHTEVSTRETYKGVAPYAAYRSFLKERGFKVKIEAIPKGWDMGNVLFVKEK